jgi:hypothetical protein
VSVAGIPEAIRRSMQILATHRALFGRRDRSGRVVRTMSETDIARVIVRDAYVRYRSPRAVTRSTPEPAIS